MEKTLLDYWLSLYRRKRIVLLIVLSAMLTALLLSAVLPPVYEAKAVFFVPTKKDAVTFLSDAGQSMAKTPLVPETKEEPHGPYIGILKSKAIAELVRAEYSHKTVFDLMKKDTDFVLNNEYLIEVYARDTNPEMAAGIANAFVRYFNQLMQGYPQDSTITSTRKTLDRQIQETEQRLSLARKKLEEFQRRNRTASIDEETKQYVAMKMSFKNKLDTAKVAYKENEEKIRALTEQLRKEKNLLSSEEVIVSSPLLESLQRQLTDIEVKMAGLRGEVTESHPDYVALKNQGVQLKQGMEKEVNRIVKSQIKAPNTFYENLRQQLVGLYVEKEAVGASIKASKALLKDIDDEMARIPAIQAQLDNLHIEVERNRKILNTLRTNLGETGAQNEKEMQTAVVVDRASPPERPSFPILWLNMVVAGLAGIIVGIFYVFFLDYLEQTRKRRMLKLIQAIEASDND